MGRYCIITDGYIANTIVWDGVTQWDAPEGALVLPEDEARAHGYDYPPQVAEEAENGNG